MQKSSNPYSTLPYWRWGEQRRVRCVKLETKTSSCLNHGTTSSSNLSAAPSPQDKPKKRPRLVHNDSNLKVYSQDDFSKLPDHIITCHILPRLDLKERVRSSILSRRWKYFWRCSLGTDLVFDFPCGVSTCESDMLRYRQEVDFITKSFTGPELDQFSVRFEVAPLYHHAIRRWIKFAFRWDVKRLNLDLTHYYSRPLNKINKFPCLKRLLPIHNPKNHVYPCISLKELSLTYVNTPGETVEYLLSCCPFLELLYLHDSLSSNLKICGPSLKLKHLEIWRRLVPLKVEISAPNLIILKHDKHVGLNGDFLLNNAPLLADLHMPRTPFDQLVNEFVQRPLDHFGYFFQLKKLEISMPLMVVWRSIDLPLKLPTLVKLEELKVTMNTILDVLMLWPIVVLKAAPNLQRFLIKQINRPRICAMYTEQEIEMMRGATEFTHTCLKVLEVTGFAGSRVVCEMVERVLFIAAVPLEKVVIEFDERCGWWSHPFYRRELWKNQDMGSCSTRENKSMLLRSLETIMPTNAKLVVL
ncbi:diphthine--ammonia ligase [Orobanche minor]